MKILKEGCPSQDGFHMPAEYEPHKGTILIWPKRPGSWIYGAKKGKRGFCGCHMCHCGIRDGISAGGSGGAGSCTNDH